MPKVATTTRELPLEARAAQLIQTFAAPKTTQDAHDVAAAEFATANLLRQYADKRYEDAKGTISAMYQTDITELKSKATNALMKSTSTRVGEDWQITLAANKPSTRVSVDDLRTELIKRGVAVDIIDKAISKVEKLSSPALIITAGVINGD